LILNQRKIIKIINKSSAGNNRYIGSQNSTTDLLIFQDADDIPHYQRNQIIHQCFKNYPNIVHILHGFSRIKINKKFDINNIPIKILNHNIFTDHTEMASYHLTNGNIAIRRSIINNIEWDIKKFRGQDVRLNKNIYKKYGEYLIIRLQLYIYRENLTTRYNI